MSFGVPFKGSKNKIASQIVNLLPASSTLYDVFAGGCAISHCALCSNKFSHVVAIDNTDIPTLFRQAWNGVKFFPDWVSRDEYFERYKFDPYVSAMWSFGNKPGHYIYGQKIMDFKHALHNAIVHGDFTMLRAQCPDVWEEAFNATAQIPLSAIYLRRTTIGAIVGKHMGSRRSASVENLERLNRLQSIAASRSLSTASFAFIQTDYTAYTYADPNGVIYCDPPYKGTDGYASRISDDSFDFAQFYDWCEAQTLPVFISEYAMPDDRFRCVAAFDKTSTICATKTIPVVEKIWRPRCQLEN